MGGGVKQIQELLVKQIADQSKYCAADKASFLDEEGVVLSINDAALLLDHIEKLEAENKQLETAVNSRSW